MSGRVLKDTIFGEGGRIVKKLAIVLVLLMVVSLVLGSIGCAKEEEEVPLKAGFAASPTLGKAPLQVQFTDQSTGDITSREWDFDGDGTVDSTAQNPSHTYDTAGTYTVSLTVRAADGSDDTETKVGYIRVGELLAGFTASPTSGIVPLAVEFTDQSVGEITSWAWDFGDGGTSTEQSPSHTYNTVGTYTVSLTVTAAVGTDTWAGVTIEVQAVPELEQQTWKLCHSFPATGTRGMAAQKFADLVEEVTGGKIQVEVFPNGTLLSGANAVTGLVTGSIDVTFDSPYFWGTRLPWVQFLYLYGLWQSWEHAYDVVTDPVWQEVMAEKYAAVGGHYLGDTVESMTSVTMYQNHPVITDIRDMAGWKYGIYTGSAPSVSAKFIGYEFVYIDYGQHQSAMATGMIDSFSIAVTTCVAQKVWTFSENAILGRASSNSVVVVNPDTWDALPAYWQNVIETQVMPQVIDYAMALGQENEEAELQALIDGYESVGGTVTDMSDEAWQEVATEMREMPEVQELLAMLGPDIAALIYDWQPG